MGSQSDQSTGAGDEAKSLAKPWWKDTPKDKKLVPRKKGASIDRNRARQLARAELGHGLWDPSAMPTDLPTATSVEKNEWPNALKSFHTFMMNGSCAKSALNYTQMVKTLMRSHDRSMESMLTEKYLMFVKVARENVTSNNIFSAALKQFRNFLSGHGGTSGPWEQKYEGEKYYDLSACSGKSSKPMHVSKKIPEKATLKGMFGGATLASAGAVTRDEAPTSSTVSAKVGSTAVKAAAKKFGKRTTTSASVGTPKQRSSATVTAVNVTGCEEAGTPSKLGHDAQKSTDEALPTPEKRKRPRVGTASGGKGGKETEGGDDIVAATRPSSSKRSRSGNSKEAGTPSKLGHDAQKLTDEALPTPEKRKRPRVGTATGGKGGKGNEGGDDVVGATRLSPSKQSRSGKATVQTLAEKGDGASPALSPEQQVKNSDRTSVAASPNKNKAEEAARARNDEVAEKKEQGREQQLADLMKTARSHIRRRDFARAEQVVGVMKAFCESESMPMPASLLDRKDEKAAEIQPGPLGGASVVDSLGADEAPKGDALEIARDVLRRCFPLKHPSGATDSQESDSVIIPKTKRQAAKSSTKVEKAANLDQVVVEDRSDEAAKFASIPEAEPGDYVRLQVVGHAFRESLVAAGKPPADADEAMKVFFELFQLDDKSLDGMASQEYQALVRHGDSRHFTTALSFAEFWAAAASGGANFPEPPPRLPTSEERRLAADSGVPPDWRVQIFHRVKREDLVVLTSPDGSHEFTTKQGLRGMASMDETFAAERQRMDEAGKRHEEAKRQAAASIDRRRQFAAERQRFLAKGAEERALAQQRFENYFAKICACGTEGVALHGLPADCLGTYVRLDETFDGGAAYERLATEVSGTSRTFLFHNSGRWVVAGALDAAAQPFAYVEDKAKLPQDIDRDGAVWKVPDEVTGGFQELQEGVAWCASLSNDDLTRRAFTILHKGQDACPVCRSHPAGDGACDAMDDLEGRAERLTWTSYEDVPDATEEERASYPAILQLFESEGYPYFAGVKKLMALYGKSPAAMATKEFHQLVRNDPVNAICNGFDSSAVLYFIMFWEKFGSTTWTARVKKTAVEIQRMDDKKRKEYVRNWHKYEVDPSAAYEVRAQTAVLQDLQIDMPLTRLIADVTHQWKQDLKGFLSDTSYLQEDADASGLRAARCGADLLPEPTEAEWAMWGSVLRGFDEWRPPSSGKGPGRSSAGKCSKHVEPLQRLVQLHGKAPAVVASERYQTVVGWELGKESAEAAAVGAFVEFWKERGDSKFMSPTAGLLFGTKVPARWTVLPLDKVADLRKARKALQLPATWELRLEPAFLAVEPAEDGGMEFHDEESLKAKLQAQLEARQAEQRRKDAVAQEWRLPPRYEVEFMADGTPRVIGPDGIVYTTPESIPRPVWMLEDGKVRGSKPTAPRKSGDGGLHTLVSQMIAAANSYNFQEACRLHLLVQERQANPEAWRGRVLQQEAKPRAATCDAVAGAEIEATAAEGAVEGVDADAANVEDADSGGGVAEGEVEGEVPQRPVGNRPPPVARKGSRPIVKIESKCRAGTMPIVKKTGTKTEDPVTRKYTKQAGLKAVQEKQIETGELELKARCWRVVGVRTADGGLVSVDDCTEKDPTKVTCVLVQIAEEITKEEERRVRKEWGLDEKWVVTVRIRLSGNQITVRSPEGNSYCKRNQLLAAKRNDTRRKQHIHQAAALEELLRMLKSASSQGVFEISGAEGVREALNGVYMWTGNNGKEGGVSYVNCRRAVLSRACVESGRVLPTAVAVHFVGDHWEFTIEESNSTLAVVDHLESPFASRALLVPDTNDKLEACCVQRLNSQQVIAWVVGKLQQQGGKLCRLCNITEHSGGSGGRSRKRGEGAGENGDQGEGTKRQEAYEAQLRYLAERRSDAPRGLAAMAAHMCSRFAEQQPACLQAVRSFFETSSTEGKLRLGTACSGTDSPTIALRHLVSAIGSLFGGHSTLDFEHVFSCEFDEQKQEFLLKNYEMDHLFSDVTQLGRRRAWDVKNQSVQDVPGDIDVFVAGFSCKDLSFMNSYRKTLEEMGQSGATLRGSLDYIERYTPRVVLLENVYAIDRADQHGLKQVNIVMEGLRARGYVAGYKLCNSCDYYVPQVRHRIWMWGFRVDADAAVTFRAGVDINPRMDALLRSLEEPCALHFDDLLLQDDDERVLQFNRQLYAKVGRSRDGSGTKKGQNGSNAKLTWQQKYTMHRMKLDYAHERPYTSERGAQWLNMLNERTRELLDLKCLDVMNEQSMDPREVPMLWDLLQSVERVPGSRVRRDRQNYATCVLPPSLLWHTVRHRYILGQEKLALQGIFAEDLKDIASFPQALLGDLAGNAFTSTVCLANMLAAFALFNEACVATQRAAATTVPRALADVSGEDVD